MCALPLSSSLGRKWYVLRVQILAPVLGRRPLHHHGKGRCLLTRQAVAAVDQLVADLIEFDALAERLDHHFHIYPWDVPWLTEEPSAIFRQQCYISFDVDETMLQFTATSPLVGADRIIWASDFPHPDAKYPGTTAELATNLAGLPFADQQAIAGGNAARLYGLDLGR